MLLNTVEQYMRGLVKMYLDLLISDEILNKLKSKGFLASRWYLIISIPDFAP